MKTVHSASFGLLLLGALLLVLPACGGGGGGGDGGAASKPSRRAAAQPVIEEEAEKPVAEEKARYSYNSIGKRDPFRSFIAKELVVGNVDGGPLGPLQKHEIDQYHLRGIVWNVQAPRALVEDPDGIGHVVDLGTLIGKNWGKVTQIKPQEIIITEEYRDPIENELIINEITMRLPDPEEVGK